MTDEKQLSASFCRWSLLTILLGIGSVLFLLWSQRHVPIIDWPNHLARHYLEALHIAGETLPPFYDVEYRVLPNLGADITLPLLMQIADPRLASHLFLSFSVLLYFLGPAIFIWQINGIQPASLLASAVFLPFILSSQFFWGFINFYSGFGLAFLILAHFGWTQAKLNPSFGGLLLQAVLVTLLFFWHLAAWGIFVVLMGCQLLWLLIAQWQRSKRLLFCLKRAGWAVLPLLPSLVGCLMYVVGVVGQTDLENDSGQPWWGTWERKVLMPLTLFRGYDWLADITFAVGVLAVLAVCIHVKARLSRPQSWLLLGLAVLTILYVVLPYRVGATTDIDSRLLPAMLVCVLAYVGSMSVRYWRLGLAIVVVMIAARSGSVYAAWDRIGKRLEAHEESFQHIEREGRVLPIVLLPSDSKIYPEVHFPSWAVIERHAFVPILFVYRTQQPLIIRQPYEDCRNRSATNNQGDVVGLDEMMIRSCYDYVWVFNARGDKVQLPASYQKIFYKKCSDRVWIHDTQSSTLRIPFSFRRVSMHWELGLWRVE